MRVISTSAIVGMLLVCGVHSWSFRSKPKSEPTPEDSDIAVPQEKLPFYKRMKMPSLRDNTKDEEGYLTNRKLGRFDSSTLQRYLQDYIAAAVVQQAFRMYQRKYRDADFQPILEKLGAEEQKLRQYLQVSKAVTSKGGLNVKTDRAESHELWHKKLFQNTQELELICHDMDTKGVLNTGDKELVKSFIEFDMAMKRLGLISLAKRLPARPDGTPVCQQLSTAQ